MRLFICCTLFWLSTAPLAGCAWNLNQASRPWDEKPVLAQQRTGKNWGPTQPDSPATQPRPQNTKPAASTQPGWKVNPPDLPQSEAPASSAQASVLAIAQQYLGVPYRFGGASPQEGFDCSGLVQYVFAQKGLSVQRQANHQYLQGRAVGPQELTAGDLVFFSVSGGIVDHVGIYAGEGLFIHAPRTGRNVSYDSLDSAYFKTRYQGARRLL